MKKKILKHPFLQVMVPFFGHDPLCYPSCARQHY
jgi:hypothetical protein